MKVLKFKLSGKTAFFKRPDVNTFYYFTYGQVHKVALMGIFGAILGLGGYNSMKKEDSYPEFYTLLKDIKISIVPCSYKGFFSKKVQYFNNSVGYASKETGGNLIIKEQWLENPAWDIYVIIEDDITNNLANAIKNRTCKYIPYLGKNDHYADIEYINIYENINEAENPKRIDSFVPKELIEIDIEDEEGEVIKPFKYEETLPISLDVNNLYEFKKLVFTNMLIMNKKCDVYTIEDKNIVFF